MASSHLAPILFPALLVLAGSCSNSSRDSSSSSTILAATAVTLPPGVATGAGAQGNIQSPFLPDPNQGGTAANLFITDLSYGRLVNVFDFDSSTGARRLLFRDVVIGPQVASDGVDYLLEENLAQEAELTILHKQASPLFGSALLNAENARVSIADNGLPPLLPPWTMVARNAAISVQFSDLLDESTVNASNIQLTVGSPPAVPFEARIIADRSHGAYADPDGDTNYSFYPTRAIIDLTISALDAQRSSVPLAINGLGLPASPDGVMPNVALRLPTQTAPGVGQNTILRNASGNALSLAGNGTTDTTVRTNDVLRAFRSGGLTSETGDPVNGMLPDSTAPQIVGNLDVNLSGVILPDPQVVRGFIVPTTAFTLPTCASQLVEGDLIVQPNLTAVVYDQGVQGAGVATGLKIRVLFSSVGAPSAGAAQAVTAYDANNDDSNCFLRYAPTPGTLPNTDVSPDAVATVQFSEPIDPLTLDAFYGFTISDMAISPVENDDLVGGQVFPSADLIQGSFSPSAPLPHLSGSSETWFVRVGATAGMPVQNLAGLDLANPIDDASFTVDANAGTEDSGSIVLRFDGRDMLGSDGFAELRGQFRINGGTETLNPRPISRFEGAVDRNNPLPGAMTPFSSGVQAPLVPLGSKLQQLWRHADLGFNLLDEANLNLDVEGLSWAPVGGAVVMDQYDEFSITLGHASMVPDEYLNPLSGFPKYPNSGLNTNYDSNYLEPGSEVHPRQSGYTVNPADLYTTASGTVLMPFPLNEGVSVDDFSYYTWRDTAIQAVGGANGNGVPLDQEVVFLGLDPFDPKDYDAGLVPTLGLPLLMEFRCFPDQSALGLNSFDVSLAANSSARPNFRASSSGGIDTIGNPILIDPDNQPVATGGFNPTSNPPGQPTQGVDNVSYIGSVDFVTTTSRAHSIWFDTQASAPNYTQPVWVGELPAGTQVELAYRGADFINGGTPGAPLYIGNDAAGLDPYGDPLDLPITGTPSFSLGSPSWTSDIANVNGSRHIQVRISFIGNPVTNETANLGGLSFSWDD